MAARLSATARRASTAVAATLLGALAAGSACSEDPERPPPLPVTGRVVENPIACQDLQNATAVDAALLLDGSVANCAVNGLICPLFSASLSGACDASLQTIGRCTAEKWVLGCRTLRDASSEPGD
jgi:hypothetical protein